MPMLRYLIFYFVFFLINELIYYYFLANNLLQCFVAEVTHCYLLYLLQSTKHDPEQLLCIYIMYLYMRLLTPQGK